MNLISQTVAQFLSLWRGMTPSQRATLSFIPLLMLVGFGWLMWQPGQLGDVALSYGKAFTTEELIAAEEALLREGLTDFHRQGQRLLVPGRLADQYNAALLKLDALPTDFGSQLVKKYESMGPFSTEKERHEMREAMLLQEVRRIILAIPEIANATVNVANSGRRSWSQKSRVTANITVWPRGERELPRHLVSALQTAVANMIPDLKPADVSVFDARNGITHAADPGQDPLENRLVQRARDFQKQYEGQIEQDLSYIPNVGVTVNVDLENLKSSVVRNQVVDPKKFAAVFTSESTVTDAQQQRPPRGEAGQVANRPGSLAVSQPIDRTRNFNERDNQQLNGVSFEVSEKELIAAMPKAVQVSVSIPREYYRSVAAQRKTDGEQDPALLDVAAIEKEVLDQVAKSVRNLIPADSPPTAVTVNSIDRVTVTIPEPTIPVTERMLQLVRDWGGPATLLALALFALVMLRRTAPKLPDTPPMMMDPKMLKTSGPAAEPEPAPREPTRRDQLQSLVRDNPEATAAIISKWLQAAQ
jgi:flagellar M-ring protein FliF